MCWVVIVNGRGGTVAAVGASVEVGGAFCVGGGWALPGLLVVAGDSCCSLLLWVRMIDLMLGRQL